MVWYSRSQADVLNKSKNLPLLNLKKINHQHSLVKYIQRPGVLCRLHVYCRRGKDKTGSRLLRCYETSVALAYDRASLLTLSSIRK